LATPTSTPTPTPDVPPPGPPVPGAGRRGLSRTTWLGLAVSAVSLAGVVWWALHQEPPTLPDTAGEWLDLAVAIALYAFATVVRGERWYRLLQDEDARPHRRDSQMLNVVGYMGNNVLPARAGDAFRVVLMAPRAECSARTVVGTLVAERILDVTVIVAIFVVVGYAVLGNVGEGSVELIALVTVVLIAAAVAAYQLVRRNERLHAFVVPLASATLGLRRAHHGLLLLAMTGLVWATEAGVWIAVGGAAGFPMDFVEGLYLVALASIFSMIPSGPGYAGTQDTAVAVGIKALGGSGGVAVSYIVLLRFVIVVPITLLGFVLLAVRYGGIARLRSARREARA
jgi:glycosyltransferase 2 family protein